MRLILFIPRNEDNSRRDQNEMHLVSDTGRVASMDTYHSFGDMTFVRSEFYSMSVDPDQMEEMDLWDYVGQGNLTTEHWNGKEQAFKANVDSDIIVHLIKALGEENDEFHIKIEYCSYLELRDKIIDHVKSHILCRLEN